MNYRHAFHAGNHADVVKHMALLYCLDALRRKDAPFGVLDTHAGAGRYDLFSAEAMRSGEWRQGVGLIWDWANAPEAVKRLVAAVSANNADGALRYYPGSPLLIAQNLRGHDRLDACELEAKAYAELRRATPNAHLHRRDGWEALTGLLPLKERRGLVLIDPPYEEGDELQKAAAAIAQALHRFGYGIYLWWRPLKSLRELASADAVLKTNATLKTKSPAKLMRADFWVDTPAPGGALLGSSLILINAPFGAEAALKEGLAALAKRLARGAAGWRLQAL